MNLALDRPQRTPQDLTLPSYHPLPWTGLGSLRRFATPCDGCASYTCCGAWCGGCGAGANQGGGAGQGGEGGEGGEGGSCSLSEDDGLPEEMEDATDSEIWDAAIVAN